MNELSYRLQIAVDFLKGNGIIKRDKELAVSLGVPTATISMVTTGRRVPTWDLLLTFCDRYPISFEWLRTGVGPMIRGDTEADKMRALLKRIEELEKKVDELTAALE